MQGIFDDYLGVLEEGVQAVFSCLTQMSLRVTLGTGSQGMKRLVWLTLNVFYVIVDLCYVC